MNDTLHVVPNNDLIDHEEDGDECPCGPSVIFEEFKTIVVHNSLDGREMKE